MSMYFGGDQNGPARKWHLENQDPIHDTYAAVWQLLNSNLVDADALVLNHCMHSAGYILIGLDQCQENIAL